MHRYALAATFALALCTPLVSEAAGPRVTKGTIAGAVTESDVTTGPCAAVVDANGTDSYDTMCPAADSADCKCINASHLILSGGFGRGTANLIATADESATVETGSSDSACAPAFAVVTLSINAKGKIPASTQTLNALGAVCGTAGTTTVNVLGGFSIEGTNSNPPASGSGIFNGTVSTTGSVSVTLTGLITNP
jgi:hypothetical protein